MYRGGYSPEERRKVEAELFSGRLLGAVATNALELGVDVGALDVTLHLGFQGSIASMRQQAGRAGRREQPCMAVYVAYDGPLDQHFMRNPEDLFSRSVESAQVRIRQGQVDRLNRPAFGSWLSPPLAPPTPPVAHSWIAATTR